MEMENFKELLNKCNTQYEFVKLCDLEQEKKYDVTMFNIEENETRSVILDNKYILVLPDIYIDAILIESIFFYNTNPQIKYKLFYNQSNIYWIE